MEAKISKAQLSVWEWKEKAYEEIKHLPIQEQLRIIHERTKQTIERIQLKQKQRTSHNRP